MIGAAKGVIRSMLADADAESEAIPVDIAINGIILIAKIVSSEQRLKYLFYLIFIKFQKKNEFQIEKNRSI